MSERAKIEDRLHKKEAEILGLEEKIKAARVYVQALRDVLRMLNDEAPDVGAPTDDGDTKLRAGSTVAQARDAIFESGAPMHIDDILAAIGKDATRETKASLIGSLSAYVRRGEIFTRPAPNTFGLAELGHDSVPDEQSVERPPAGFGKVIPSQQTDEEDIPF